MAQSDELVEVLKKQLKAQGLTYAEVAHALELSEASVKRLFAESNFTLKRLELVCELMNMQVSDLFDQLHKQNRRIEKLTLEQEKEIVDDHALLLVTVSVINGFAYPDLIRYYNLDEHELVQKLAHLDRLKLIELQPGNRIKLRVAPNFHWHADGPIQKFFLQKVEKDFFNSRFNLEEEKLLVLNGHLSAANNKELQNQLDKFVIEINQMIKKDASLPMEEKFGNTLVLALRPWKYDALFSRYRKQ